MRGLFLLYDSLNGNGENIVQFIDIDFDCCCYFWFELNDFIDEVDYGFVGFYIFFGLFMIGWYDGYRFDNFFVDLVGKGIDMNICM